MSAQDSPYSHSGRSDSPLLIGPAPPKRRRSPTSSVSPTHGDSPSRQFPTSPTHSDSPSRQFPTSPTHSDSPSTHSPQMEIPRTELIPATPQTDFGDTLSFPSSPTSAAAPTSPLPTYLSPTDAGSQGSSRRSSLSADIDSRRESLNKMASGVVKDLRKGVKNVSDNTKKAGHRVVDQSKQLTKDVEATTRKVKDRTVMMGTSVRGASHWVAMQTSRSAKQAMQQARSGLSLGEKTTLFLTEKVRTWSRKGFTHVFMFLMIAAYTALGAALFMALEAPHENAEKLVIEYERNRLIDDLYVESRLHERHEWREMAKARLRPFEEQLRTSFSHGVSSDTDNRVWTFWKAMFFCSTITTTIGYGHMTPVTTAGQTLCIVYAIIGIPLMLILMADFGKLFTRGLKAIFRLIFRINRSEQCLKIRRSALVKGCKSGKRWLCRKIFFCKPCRGEEDSEEGTKDEEQTLEELIGDDNFNLPISLALLILVIYILIGCFVFPLWEDWTFFEAFYFIFISISTIGFGDYVPQHPGFMMATTLYFIFGLALTAMCINIIQEKLTNTFREASLKMKERFSSIMAKAEQEAEEAARMKELGSSNTDIAAVHRDSKASKEDDLDKPR
ncbi:TWiK family of potassium channels protein 18 isoform X2 [Hyalella azteca]|uniref:TWiK family of potassium channels protein 18 isoform X2 n=1 Tax=Hyalella azteca TaxID=294128 RepID=A0A8B7NP99_HYAAZ|nr:TWiK family of potassium channels protein 18 isoform X2 [Hyalella azteca]